MSTTAAIATAAGAVKPLTFDEKQRTALFDVEHPAYTEHAASWQTFLDAYDGEGGFLDGSYLVRYPREEQGHFEERQKKARYHNYVEALVDLYVRKIFSARVTRTAEDEGLKQFWANVTGGGVSIDAFMAQSCTKALAAGHVGILVDKSRELSTGPSKADEKARPFLTQYLPTHIQDWRTKDDKRTLTSLKLREAKPAQDFLASHPEGDNAVRMLLWTRDAWARVDRDKDVAIESEATNLGVVPFVFLAPKPSSRHELIGKSLLGNANIIEALFNRCSEEDEVLRDQAFSLFTVNVGPEGDVQKVKDQIGGDVGTTRAMVLQGEADYITPDMNVPKAIRENIAYLVQEIFRMAHVQYQRDSREAESAEAIQLKHDELNAMLGAIAAACQAAEIAIAKYYFAWTTSTPQLAEAAFTAAKVTVAYATEFFLADLEAELRAWALAMKQRLGATMEQRIKLRIVKRLEPDLDEETTKTIEGEIKQIADEPPPAPIGAELLRAPGRLKQVLDREDPSQGGATA